MFSIVAAVAYIPTSWEAPPGTAPEWGVPTTQYAAAQLDCTAKITDESADIREYLAQQLATMQPNEPFGDPRNPAAPYLGQLRRIRGLRLTVTNVRAKFKFDGSESDEVREQVVAGLTERDLPDDREALAHLLRRHPPKAGSSI